MIQVDTDSQKRLYVKNYETWKWCFSQHSFSSKELKVREVPGGIILPIRSIASPCLDPLYEGGVTDSEGNFVAGSIRVNEKNPGFMAAIRGYSVKAEELQHIQEEVIYGGVAISFFGHFMAENMARLWYVLQRNDLQKKIVFITTGGWQAYMSTFLELLGIDLERLIILDKPTKFLSVTVPDESVHTWGWFYTKEYPQIYQTIREGVAASKHKKIYLTHSAYKSGITCCNEKYFEDFFANKGFFVVSPEKYSLQEQIGLMKGAEEVACMISTLSHMILFARPHTKLIMLTRTDNEVLFAQGLINEVSQADWYLIDASLNFLYGERTYGVVLLGPTEYWRKFVKDHYGEDNVPDMSSDAVLSYMREWCRFYASGDNIRILASMDIASHFRRMYEVLIGEECPRLSREDYVDGLKQNLTSKENYNKALAALAGNPVLVVYEITTEKYRSACCYNGQICGTGDSLIKDIRISFTDEKTACVYRFYYKGQGWTNYMKSGSVHGEGTFIYGLEIALVSPCNSLYELNFRIHVKSGWSPWLSSGQGAAQEDSPLDAIQIVLKKK